MSTNVGNRRIFNTLMLTDGAPLTYNPSVGSMVGPKQKGRMSAANTHPAEWQA
jgi:hypothetical protein